MIHVHKKTLYLILALVLLKSVSFGYHSYEDQCMGTVFNILIDEDNSTASKSAAQEAFQEANRLNLILSDYLNDSELSRFSRSSYEGNYFKLSNDLFTVLKFGQKISHDTNGSFDMTIGLLSRLWRIARFQNTLPDPDKIRTAHSLSGYRHLKLNSQKKSGRLTIPGVKLDLGGLAKGYTADQMLKKLQQRGMPRCLIDAGGDLVIGDPPRDSKGWRIKVAGAKNHLLSPLILSNTAIATSGDHEQFLFLDGKKFSHIINPHTGMGLTSQVQATVIAPTGIQADALASASVVMGAEKSGLYFKRFKGKGIKVYFTTTVDGEKNTETINTEN